MMDTPTPVVKQQSLAKIKTSRKNLKKNSLAKKKAAQLQQAEAKRASVAEAAAARLKAVVLCLGMCLWAWGLASPKPIQQHNKHMA